MNILVTGAAGFVGRALVARLLAQGHAVVGIDDLSAVGSRVSPQAVPGFQFIFIDARSYFRFHPPAFDVIYHCAAVVGGRQKIEGDPLAVAADLSIDADLFSWLAKFRFKGKLVYFSSSAVYPLYQQDRTNYSQLIESDVTLRLIIGEPDQTYGWAKLSGEYLAQYAVKNYGMNVIIYRPFSGYGEEQSLDYPFPSIVKRVVDGEDPVTVWGSGEQCRDFIHIEDVLGCVFASQDKLQSGEALNIGNGIPVSFTNLALAAGAKNVINDMSKPEGVFYRVARTTKMQQFYKPTITLNEGIARMKRHLSLTKQAA